MPIQFSCPCGKKLSVADAHAGKQGKCPQCGQVLTVPVPAAAAASGGIPMPPALGGAQGVAAQAAPSAATKRMCAICQSPITPHEAAAPCPGCQAPYHVECWEENQGCAIYGCGQVPQTEGRGELEIPVSFWGQEEKPCPSCGQTIQAAAVRCRHCGATFESARPESSLEFRQRAGRLQRVPTLRRNIVWLFVMAALPCTAPVAAVFVPLWYWPRRQEVAAQPGVYVGLCWLAMVISIAQTATLFLMTMLYSLVRT